MKLEIEISEEDLEEIENTEMTYDETFGTLKGRVYRAIIVAKMEQEYEQEESNQGS